MAKLNTCFLHGPASKAVYVFSEVLLNTRFPAIR